MLLFRRNFSEVDCSKEPESEAGSGSSHPVVSRQALATFLQNFEAVFDIPQKILQKNEQKFAEKRGRNN